MADFIRNINQGGTLALTFHFVTGIFDPYYDDPSQSDST